MLGELAAISCQDKKTNKKKKQYMLVAPLSVNSSETKEGKQKLIFNKLYKLKKNNNNNKKNS